MFSPLSPVIVVTEIETTFPYPDLGKKDFIAKRTMFHKASEF